MEKAPKWGLLFNLFTLHNVNYDYHDIGQKLLNGSLNLGSFKKL